MSEPRTSAPRQPWYFAVATTKFVVMSIVTFGIYDAYWFYRQWQCERTRTGDDISPFWRTFFAPLFAFSLFRRIDRASEETGSGRFAHQLYALSYFVLLMSFRLPDPYWLVSMLAFVPLIPVQSAASRVNEVLVPGAPRNDQYTLSNVLTIVIGGLFLLLALAGTFIPLDEEPENQPVNVSV